MDKLISSLVDFIIEQKKLQFTINETTFDEKLYANNILKVETNKISINDFWSISTHFIEKYKKNLKFKLSNNFKTNANFLKSVKEDFTCNGYVQDYHILEKELWMSIVKESNLVYKCSFNDYLNEVNPEGIFDFIDAYSDILSELNLTNNEILENAIILIKCNTSSITTLNKVLNGIKNKCKANYDVGVSLLNKSITLSEDNENIISAIVAGLYENNRNEFYEFILKNLIIEETKLNPILFGLSWVSELTVSDCDLFIKMINNYNKRDIYILSTLSIVFSILKSNNTKHHIFCFKVLESVIVNEKTAYYILDNIRFIESFSQEKTDIIVKLVNQNYFTIEKYIIPISQIFWYLKEFDSFKKVIICIIENKPYEKFIKAFQSNFHSMDAVELDKFIIELLIDNSANKRQTGIEIFNELSLQQPYRFSFNILDLPPISQYKLWVALTQDFHEPKKNLTALLPLIESKSELVKESFICKMEEISEDYGGHVTKVLEENLDKNNQNHSTAIKRVKKYIEDFYCKNIDLKMSILELNSYYTHHKFIKKYNELFSKNINKTVEKGVRENSLLSFFGTNTIQLSKGGGWRIGKNKEISQLGQFGESFTMPRSYFINPNKFELSKGFELRQDWKDDEFIDINKILENE